MCAVVPSEIGDQGAKAGETGHGWKARTRAFPALSLAWVAYVWVVISLALMLVLYLKVVQMGRKVTQLTRAIALSQARSPASDRER